MDPFKTDLQIPFNPKQIPAKISEEITFLNKDSNSRDEGSNIL
jgi:hypothetical protein